MTVQTTDPFAYLHQIKADYSAAKPSRFRRRRKGIPANGSGADYHYRSEADYLRVMEYARDMDRNDCIVGSAIDRATGNILRRGFTLDINTGDTGLDVELLADWNDWGSDAERCDLAGEWTFKDFERIVTRLSFVDGDCMVLPIEETGSLQLAEAHRLRTPTNTSRNVVLGVLLDQSRRRLEYWFTKDDIDPLRIVSRVSDMERWPVRDSDGNRQLFHIYDPKRYSQTRGVTALAPIFDILGMFEDINIAKIAQQQLVSSIGLIRRLNGPGQVPNLGSVQQTTLRDGSTETNVFNRGPALEFRVGPGEDLEAFQSNVPNAEFFLHVRLMLQLIGMNLGLPLVALLMDGSETNFSGWRGAIDQSKIRFEQLQDQLARRFHSALYEWWVRQRLKTDPAMARAIEKNRSNSQFDIFGHQWIVPTWPYIQPLQDAQTDGLRLQFRLISPRSVCAERGKNFERVIEETIKDNELAISAANDAAARLNQKYPQASVNWREIWSMPVQEGLSMNLSAKETETHVGND